MQISLLSIHKPLNNPMQRTVTMTICLVFCVYVEYLLLWLLYKPIQTGLIYIQWKTNHPHLGGIICAHLEHSKWHFCLLHKVVIEAMFRWKYADKFIRYTFGLQFCVEWQWQHEQEKTFQKTAMANDLNGFQLCTLCMGSQLDENTLQFFHVLLLNWINLFLIGDKYFCSAVARYLVKRV